MCEHDKPPDLKYHEYNEFNRSLDMGWDGHGDDIHHDDEVLIPETAIPLGALLSSGRKDRPPGLPDAIAGPASTYYSRRVLGAMEDFITDPNPPPGSGVFHVPTVDRLTLSADNKVRDGLSKLLKQAGVEVHVPTNFQLQNGDGSASVTDGGPIALSRSLVYSKPVDDDGKPLYDVHNPPVVGIDYEFIFTGENT